MSIRRLLGAAALCLALATVAVAAEGELKIEGLRHMPAEGARLFWIDTYNSGDFDRVVHGRLALINVYDTAPPTTIPIDNYVIPKGERNSIVARWDGAPWLGQVRVMVALTDQNHQTVVESRDLLVMPQGWLVSLIVLSSTALFIGLLGALVRLARPRVRIGGSFARGSGKAVPYVVEYDDSVVAIANKLGVTWQEIVKANRLKPPYTLKPGQTVFVPKHALHRPGAPENKT
jgi:hypothetical protein